MLTRLFKSRSKGLRREYRFNRPLVLIQSDDWGRVGVRDQEGCAQLQSAGVDLGQNPYDSYSLETAADVTSLHDLLVGHHDSTGRSANIVMNFIQANLDFTRMAAENFNSIRLRPVMEGLPGNWKRPGLMAAYRQGIEVGVFYPALHGLTHFCAEAVSQALLENKERRKMLVTFWRAETPYIYWRMPWIGYEYHWPEGSQHGFLSANAQEKLIAEAAELFRSMFGARPVSACAPGYRANTATKKAWAKQGIRVAQNGPDAEMYPQMDECGVLNLYRTFDFEPSHGLLPLEEYLRMADRAFVRGMPVIISVHSINFHSSIKDFRSQALEEIGRLLSALEEKYPDLLYVNDVDVYNIVNRGKFEAPSGTISIEAKELSA